MKKRTGAVESGGVRNPDVLALVEVLRRLDEHLARQPREPPAVLTVADVAEKLRCSPDTVERLIRLGLLVPFRLVGGIRVHPDELNDFCRRRRVTTPTEAAPLEEP